LASLICTYCVEAFGSRLAMSADSICAGKSADGTPAAITNARTGSAARLASVNPRDRPRSKDTTALTRLSLKSAANCFFPFGVPPGFISR